MQLDMDIMERMQQIAKYLARFSAEIEQLNSIRDFGANTYAENIMVHLLNDVYGLRLINLNTGEQKNMPAIDLLDETATPTIAFQVTSDSGLAKIKDCIRKYFRNGVYKKAAKLKVYIITQKQEKYSQAAIDNVIREEIDLLVRNKKTGSAHDISFSFRVDRDILDRLKLQAQLMADNDLEKIRRTQLNLLEQFGSFYERVSLGDYYVGLKGMFYDVVMGDEKGMTLNEVYVEPSFAVINSSLKKDNPALARNAGRKFSPADSRYKVGVFIDDLFAKDNTLDLKIMSRLVLILGYPGEGKSTFCKKFIHNYISQENVKKKPLFYIPLKNIMEARKFIFNTEDVLYSEACSLAGQDLGRQQFYKSFLVLDGLDEIYMRDNLRMQEIDDLCLHLTRLMEKYEDLQIILTSRYGYVDDEKLTEAGINIIQLTALSLDQQKIWLTKYLKFHPETWLTEKDLELFHSQSKYRHIRELLEQPLLLLMVASIYNRIDETANKSGIYERLFTELLERKYARDGKLKIYQQVTIGDLRTLIQEIAFAIFISGKEYITKSDLLRLEEVGKFLKLLPQGSFTGSIKGVMISFYFREVEKSGGDEPDEEDKSNFAIEFLHKSLREYMTAEKIFVTIKEKFLDQNKRTHQYIVKEATMALKIISELFGQQELSTEIKDHLKELIINNDDFDKAELIERLLCFLPEFLRTDFIVEYRMNEGSLPIDQSLRCFYGLWYFVSLLGPKRNYLTHEWVKNRFVYYLNHLRHIRLLDFSHQDFSGQRFTNIHFEQCWFSEVTFVRAGFVGCFFSNVRVNNCNFQASEMSNVYLNYSIIENCRFCHSEIIFLQIQTSEIQNCTFAEATFHNLDFITEFDGKEEYINTQIKDCDFRGAVFDEKPLKNLQAVYPSVSGYLIVQYEDAPPPYEGQDIEIETLPANYKRLI